MHNNALDSDKLLALNELRCRHGVVKIRHALDDFMQRDGAELSLCEFIERHSKEDFLGVDFLIACAASPSMLVRDATAIALGTCGILDERINNMLSAMIKDRCWIVRCSVMYSLGLRRSFEHTNEIIRRYKSWSFIEKNWVLMSLVKMGDPKASSFLWRIFRYSRNKERKYLAAAGLCVLNVSVACEYLNVEGSKEEVPELQITHKLCMDLVRENESRVDGVGPEWR